MSLINEALKKAQRARQEGASTPDASEPGGPVVRRAKPRSARSMLLLGVGAVVLVVGSMIGTAVWLTRAPDAVAAPTKAPAVAAATTAPEATVPASAVPPPPSTVTPIAVTLPPPTVVPAALPEPEKAPEPETTVPDPVKSTTASPVLAAADIPAKAAATPAAPPTPPEPAEPVPDERVHKFVESVRVMGIRSSGSESKVLMNDRVYRVNDIVERTLGVKLTKVSPASLTFTDANGAVYEKNF